MHCRYYDDEATVREVIVWMREKMELASSRDEQKKEGPLS